MAQTAPRVVIEKYTSRRLRRAMAPTTEAKTTTTMTANTTAMGYGRCQPKMYTTGAWGFPIVMTMVMTIGKPQAPVVYILGWHLPYPIAVVLAVIVVVVFASVVGAIALRSLREVYFSITTLGAVWAIYYAVENYTPLFNGYNGVYGLFDP